MNDEDMGKIVRKSLNIIQFNGQGIGDLIENLHPNKIEEITVSPEAIMSSVSEAIKLTEELRDSKEVGK